MATSSECTFEQVHLGVSREMKLQLPRLHLALATKQVGAKLHSYLFSSLLALKLYSSLMFKLSLNMLHIQWESIKKHILLVT